MEDPVLGTNVIIKIYKEGIFRDYLCATNITVDFNAEMKSIKTIGDGVWKRQRPQNIGYTVKLDGLVVLSAFPNSVSFEVLGYMTNFVDITYMITFSALYGGLKALFGHGIVSASQFGGGSDGFATSSFTILGNGEPLIQDTPVACGLKIDSVTFNDSSQDYTNQSVTVNYSGTGTLDRVAYYPTGGQTYSSTSTTFNLPRPLSGYYYYHLYLVCTNGFPGEEYLVVVSANYSTGGGGGGGGGGGTGPA